LEEVLGRVGKISETLEKTDNFSAVEASLERSRSPLAQPEDLDVVFKVQDRSRYFVKASTEAGNTEGSAVSP
jgi:outer membrane protein insertion porin family